MQIKTKIGSHEKLADIIHNQALKTKEYADQISPARVLDEEEIRSTLDPNFWFCHNTLLRREHHENHSLSGRLSAEEELAAGDRTIAHLGYVANAEFRLSQNAQDRASVLILDDYRQPSIEAANESMLIFEQQATA